MVVNYVLQCTVITGTGMKLEFFGIKLQVFFVVKDVFNTRLIMDGGSLKLNTLPHSHYSLTMCVLALVY